MCHYYTMHAQWSDRPLCRFSLALLPSVDDDSSTNLRPHRDVQFLFWKKWMRLFFNGYFKKLDNFSLFKPKVFFYLQNKRFHLRWSKSRAFHHVRLSHGRYSMIWQQLIRLVSSMASFQSISVPMLKIYRSNKFFHLLRVSIQIPCRTQFQRSQFRLRISSRTDWTMSGSENSIRYCGVLIVYLLKVGCSIDLILSIEIQWKIQFLNWDYYVPFEFVVDSTALLRR